MSKKHKVPVILKIIFLPFTLLFVVFSFAFWLLRFKPVRKFAWKQASERINTKMGLRDKNVVEGKVVKK